MSMLNENTPIEKNDHLLLIIDIDSYSPYTLEKAYHYATGLKAEWSILFLDFSTDKRDDELQFIHHEINAFIPAYGIANFWTESVDELDISFSKLKEKYIEPANVTAIVMVNYKETWLAELFRGSISNILATYFSDIDSLLIGPEHVQPFSKDDFAAGKRAWISKDEDNQVVYVKKNAKDIPGLYFKRIATDFENGLFMEELSEGETRHQMYKVTGGKVNMDSK